MQQELHEAKSRPVSVSEYLPRSKGVVIEFPDSINKSSIWDQYAQLNSTAANGGANGDTRRIKSTGEHARQNADFLLHY
jgi:hypothetical protein